MNKAWMNAGAVGALAMLMVCGSALGSEVEPAGSPAGSKGAAVGADDVAAPVFGAELHEEPAVIEVEFKRAPSASERELADQARDRWSAGDYAGAKLVLADLSAGGNVAGVGVSWLEPRGIASPGADRRVGAPRTQAWPVDLEVDNDSGTLWAAVGWAEGYSLNRSINGGFTWTETFFWAGSGEIDDVDIAVVDGYVYVGYVTDAAPDDARMRRNLAGSGASDGSYSFQIVFTAPAGEEIEELVVESNADALDNRIYFAVRETGGDIRYAWDVASDGQTFTEVSTGITNAVSGPDMSLNPQSFSSFLYMAYITSGNDIWVAREPSGPPSWQLIDTGASTTNGQFRDVRISVYADTVLVGYESTRASGTDYVISYNDGVSWANGVAGGPGGANYGVDVTARHGRGVAMVAAVDLGNPDDVIFRNRLGYSGGLWNPATKANTFDVSIGTQVVIQSIGPAYPGAPWAYGVMFLHFNGTALVPYFRAIVGCTGDANGDGVIDLQDLNEVLANFGQNVAIGTNGDVNADGVVNLTDLNAVLANFGEDC